MRSAFRMCSCQAPTLRDKGRCGKGLEDAAFEKGIDGGRGREGSRVKVPAGHVLMQGGPGHKTTACATHTDDRPIRGGGRDPRPRQTLVHGVPGHEGPLSDVLPAPYLWYAWPSGFCLEVVRLPKHKPEEGGCQRCSSGVRLHHTDWTISRRPSSPPTRSLLFMALNRSWGYNCS